MFEITFQNCTLFLDKWGIQKFPFMDSYQGYLIYPILVKSKIITLPVQREHIADDKSEECTSVQSVSEGVKPDSVASDTQTKTTTTDCVDKFEDSKEINMTGTTGCVDKNSKDNEDKEVSSSKVSKKRKFVQTNIFAFMGQGQSTKKAKVD